MKRIFFLIIFFVVPVALADQYDDGYNAGRNAGDKISQELNSTDKVNERLSKPLTSDDSPMRSFGSDANNPAVTFDAQLTQASSKSFLEIFAVPGTNGGIGTLNVRTDLNMDGQTDNLYNCPVPVEGVCANGVISCTPGTWNNCTYYRWINNNGVALEQVDSVEKLAGCYCINNSCGSNLVWNNLAQVLKDMGGGIVTTVQAGNPNLTVTSVGVDNTTISYYGQISKEVGVVNQAGSGVYLSGLTNPTSLYNPTADTLGMPGYSAQGTQDGDYSSPYKILTKAHEYKMNPVTTASCRIERDAYVTTASAPVATIKENCSSVDTQICTINEENICDYSGGNCITTIKNGAATGFLPLPQATTVIAPDQTAWTFTTTGSSILYSNTNGSGTVVTGASVWWVIKRDYTCQSTNSYNDKAADGVLSASSVSKSIVSNGSSLTYTENGSAKTVGVYKTDIKPDNCEMGCTVAKSTKNHQVGASATTWEYNNNNDDVVTIYKSCISGACPLDTGEVLVKKCQCLNDFVKATSSMQSLSKASKDIICSGN